jgi:hypothetical protein
MRIRVERHHIFICMFSSAFVSLREITFCCFAVKQAFQLFIRIKYMILLVNTFIHVIPEGKNNYMKFHRIVQFYTSKGSILK